jgi:tetrahydromethanopterin S-methyltransferase subunit G
MDMPNGKSKKNNRPAGIKPRNKQTYAQYVWIRQIYHEIDEIKVRQDRLEARVSEMSVKVACDIAELKARLDEMEKSVKFIKDEVFKNGVKLD